MKCRVTCRTLSTRPSPAVSSHFIRSFNLSFNLIYYYLIEAANWSIGWNEEFRDRVELFYGDYAN